MKICKYIGERFGELIVFERAPDHVQPSGLVRAMYRARCDCGRETVVRAADLRSGNTRTCGRHQRPWNKRHGARGTRAYRIWLGMRRRCLTPRVPAYVNYGGRGITICARWDLFENFLADMGAPPAGFQLDRIDNDGPYSPENCRWATAARQARNRRSNIKLTINGETRCLTDWATHYVANYATVRKRIQLGWDPVHALIAPPRQGRRDPSLTQPLNELPR